MTGHGADLSFRHQVINMMPDGFIYRMAERKDHAGLLSVAETGLDTGYVNDALVAVLACSMSHSIRPSDRAVKTAARAGSMTGSLFRQEAERFFRKNEVTGPVREAFDSRAYGSENDAGLKYSREEDHALLITGRGDRFGSYVEEFAGFLIDGLGMGEETVIVRDGRFLGKDYARRSVPDLLLRADPFDNLLIYYLGHGDRGVMKAHKRRHVPYAEWAAPLAGHEGNMVFINDTCFAGSAADALVELGLLPDRMMLLGPSGDGMPGNEFSRHLMHAYGRGRRYGQRENPGGTEFLPRMGPDFEYLLMRF
jgi:hypothetical protein